MEQYFSQFDTWRKRATMSADERGRMRQAVVSYMRLNPQRPAPESSGIFVMFARHQMLVAACAALLVILFGGGGVVFAAESSLPGGVLYPIKVANEEIVSLALSQSPERSASWEALRSERRLEEAETLIARGELSEEDGAYLEARLNDAFSRLEALDGKAAEAVEPALRAHDAILAVLAKGDAAPVTLRLRRAIDRTPTTPAVVQTRALSVPAADTSVSEAPALMHADMMVAEEGSISSETKAMVVIPADSAQLKARHDRVAAQLNDLAKSIAAKEKRVNDDLFTTFTEGEGELSTRFADASVRYRSGDTSGDLLDTLTVLQSDIREFTVFVRAASRIDLVIPSDVRESDTTPLEPETEALKESTRGKATGTTSPARGESMPPADPAVFSDTEEAEIEALSNDLDALLQEDFVIPDEAM